MDNFGAKQVVCTCKTLRNFKLYVIGT